MHTTVFLWTLLVSIVFQWCLGITTHIVWEGHFNIVVRVGWEDFKFPEPQIKCNTFTVDKNCHPAKTEKSGYLYRW